MLLLHSPVIFLYVIAFVLSVCSFTFAGPTGVTEVAKNNIVYHYIMTALLQRANPDDIDGEKKKGRVKRQPSSSQMKDSAKLTPTKLMHLFFLTFKNVITSDPASEHHPMSPESAKPVVKILSQKFIGFFLPNA